MSRNDSFFDSRRCESLGNDNEAFDLQHVRDDDDIQVELRTISSTATAAFGIPIAGRYDHAKTATPTLKMLNSRTLFSVPFEDAT